MNRQFNALVTEEISKNQFTRSIKKCQTDDLPDGEILIRVQYSSLNYKDALSASGHKGISRKYPHIPGIDAAGIIEESSSDDFTIGENVLVTGYDLGMNTSGGFGEYIRVPADWVVKIPDNFSIREAMCYGTAGFTAGVCIYELQRHDIYPDSGKILVTGASGGVGSLACGMLIKAGYEVTASTGKKESHQMLNNLGVNDIIHRSDVYDETGRPLLSGKWAAAIDTVGGNTLSTVIRSVAHRGAVCCLGNVEDDKFCSSVYPFLLRGVTLIGIDSAERPMDIRLHVWDKIINNWRLDNPDSIVNKEVTLEELSPEIDVILKGGQIGRIILKHSQEK